MSVVREGAEVRLEGECGVADAEALTAILSAERGLLVDLRTAGPLHSAVVQALLAHRPALVGPAADAFTARWIVPALDRLGATTPADI